MHLLWLLATWPGTPADCWDATIHHQSIQRGGSQGGTDVDCLAATTSTSPPPPQHTRMPTASPKH
jgi:hypothetical protein